MKKTILLGLGLSLLTACNGYVDQGGASSRAVPENNPLATPQVVANPTTIASQTNQPVIPTPSSSPTSSPSPSAPPSSSPAAPSRVFTTDVLLFVGTGTWSSEVSSIRSVLQSHGASFDEADSNDLNAMSLDDLSHYGTLIFPGGNGASEANSLTSTTHRNLRQAVQVKGVSYVGFCAGTFIAQAPTPVGNGDVSYGLGVVAGPVLDYYYLENQGTDIAMTLLSFADGAKKDVLWYGGPMSPNSVGGVVAKYPDGTPAISQVWSGKGLAVLSGVHPTATQSILNSLGMKSSDGLHLDLAWDIIDAAIQQKLMNAF